MNLADKVKEFAMNKFFVNTDQFETALLQVIAGFGERGGETINVQNLDNLVASTLDKLRPLVEENEIKPILEHSIAEVKSHWSGLIKLYPDILISLHCRKILECSLVVRFLIDSPEEWTKYSKKWELFSIVTMFGGWGRLDWSNIHPETNSQIEFATKEYSKNYKDFEIFFSKNNKNSLSGDLIQDLSKFKSVKSWLSPRSFENLLENDPTKTVAATSYYAWWSHSIHFSPLNIIQKKINTDFGDFSANSYQFALLEISSLIQSISNFTERPDYFHNTAKMFYYIFLLNDLRENPGRFIGRTQNHPNGSIALAALAGGKISLSRFFELTEKKRN